MDVEVALKSGYLLTPPQTFLRKTWLKKYCVLYDASQQGIQRLEIFESDDVMSPSRIVPLNDCLKVAIFPMKQQPNVFEIRRKEESHQFSTDTFQELLDWLSSLRSVAFSKPASPAVVEKQEENFLYSTIAEPDKFRVQIQATEASLRNNLLSEYDLLITPVSIALADESGRLVLKWPYRHIRRYGCNTENFSFEAGRKCDSGEGIFIFETNVGSQIFKKVDSQVSSCKRMQPENQALEKNVHRSSFPIPYETQNTSYNAQQNNFQITTRAPIKKPPRKNKCDITLVANCNRYDLEKCTQHPAYTGQLNAREAIRNAEGVIKLANDCSNVNYFQGKQFQKKNFNVPDEYPHYENALLLETTHKLRRQTLQQSPSPLQLMDPLNLETLPSSLTDKIQLEPQHYSKNDVEYARVLKKE